MVTFIRCQPIVLALIYLLTSTLAMQPDPDLDPPGLNLEDIEELTIDVSKKVEFKDGKIVQQDRDPFNLEDWPKCAVRPLTSPSSFPFYDAPNVAWG